MKKQILTAVLTLAMGVAAQAVTTFNYSSSVNSLITFSGGTFSFTPSSDNFTVTTGSAASDLGEITGSYTIGAITDSGGVSSANVTGSGTFVIHDGSHDFSATLTWLNISQVDNSTTTGLNTSGNANLSNITYTGSNADLLALLNHGTGANVLSFTFIPAVSLTTLATGTGLTSAFSGTVTVPDGGTTMALLGCALVGLATVRRTMFKAIKA